MNTRKTIYDKLFTEKVELAKHEVELSLIDDLILIVKKTDEEVKAGFAIRSQGKDVIRKGIQNEKNAIKLSEEGIKIGNNILSKMKELGIQDPIVNEKINFLKTRISGSKDRLKSIEKAITMFN